MKPILFNQEMVQAILEGRKSETRRVVKGIPGGYSELQGVVTSTTGNDSLIGSYMFGHGCSCVYKKPPYQVGDILYVRETWWVDSVDDRQQNMLIDFVATQKGYSHAEVSVDFTTDRYIKFRKFYQKKGLQPSQFMPKEAARIFLKVTEVRVERVQDITIGGWEREGIENKSEPPMYMRNEFIKLWNSTIKKQDIDRYGWDSNPWVWVIKFERCEKGAV